MQNRRHVRQVNRKDMMIEEFKGPQPQDSDDENPNASKIINVRHGGVAQENDFGEGDCESDYED